MQVTIVEPPHFEVPDNTLRSNVSTHSLLTTDTASNREGSMASSPGSSGRALLYRIRLYVS